MLKPAALCDMGFSKYPRANLFYNWLCAVKILGRYNSFYVFPSFFCGKSMKGENEVVSLRSFLFKFLLKSAWFEIFYVWWVRVPSYLDVGIFCCSLHIVEIPHFYISLMKNVCALCFFNNINVHTYSFLDAFRNISPSQI